MGVPKVEELLVEEWARLRPNQAGISAWTLNSHLKKFDNLKRQLTEDQEEERRIKEAKAAPPAKAEAGNNGELMGAVHEVPGLVPAPALNVQKNSNGGALT